MTYKYFTLDEFACPCCKQNAISPTLVALLDYARGEAGFAFKVNSGYRCEKHNEKIGGVKDSEHTKGLAADIHAPNPHMRAQIIEKWFDALRVHNRVDSFLPTRIGIYDTFVHLGIDFYKPHPVIWGEVT